MEKLFRLSYNFQKNKKKERERERKPNSQVGKQWRNSRALVARACPHTRFQISMVNRVSSCENRRRRTPAVVDPAAPTRNFAPTLLRLLLTNLTVSQQLDVWVSRRYDDEARGCGHGSRRQRCRNKLCLFYVSCSFDFRTNAEFLRRDSWLEEIFESWLDSFRQDTRAFHLQRSAGISSVFVSKFLRVCYELWRKIVEICVACSLESGFFFK